ncbi:MAG: chemotaxis protein CheW [Dehalococcoidales bacterium]
MAKQTVEQINDSIETQLVIFDLAAEFYGVDIGDVREIIRMQTVTRVPGAPSFVEGVINLRGRVVPVVDLRKRLNLKVSGQTMESRIVVVDISGRDVGVIVDGVTEVLRIPLSAVEPPSTMITNVDSDYLKGIAKLESKLIILLDLNKVLSTAEIQRVAALEAFREVSSSTEEAEKTEPVSSEPVSTAEAKKPEPVSTEPASKVEAKKTEPVSTEPASTVEAKKTEPVSSEPVSAVEAKKTEPVLTEPVSTVEAKKTEPVLTEPVSKAEVEVEVEKVVSSASEEKEVQAEVSGTS